MTANFPAPSTIVRARESSRGQWPRACKVGAWSALMILALVVGPALAGGTPSSNPAKSGSAARQASYATPEEAVQALVAAVTKGDTRSLLAILGEPARPLLSSGDPASDRQARDRFLEAYQGANRLEKSGDAKAILLTGKDDWPFPIPIAKGASGWYFDTKAGLEEALNRRIGRNELATIEAVQAYVDAQREYYARNPQNAKLLQYAQRFLSSPGKRDGLYYPTKPGEPPSPLGPLFDSAAAAGYVKTADGKPPPPYFGYRYRILKAQGPNAAGGAYDYVAHGAMIGGFALVAWPATYGNSGVMTFVVNQDGTVYEKDLGPATAATVAKMTRFDPDKSWSQEAGSK